MQEHRYCSPLIVNEDMKYRYSRKQVFEVIENMSPLQISAICQNIISEKLLALADKPISPKTEIEEGTVTEYVCDRKPHGFVIPCSHCIKITPPKTEKVSVPTKIEKIEIESYEQIVENVPWFVFKLFEKQCEVIDRLNKLLVKESK